MQYTQREHATIDQALKIIESKICEAESFNTSSMAKEYFRLRLATEPAEVFCVAFLTNQHQVIIIEPLFSGTIDGAAVYPREVVRACIKHNAAAVVLAHNHPSGNPEPSQADIAITGRLTDALGTIDVRVLDHFVVGNPDVVSFAERGLI